MSARGGQEQVLSWSRGGFGEPIWSAARIAALDFSSFCVAKGKKTERRSSPHSKLATATKSAVLRRQTTDEVRAASTSASNSLTRPHAFCKTAGAAGLSVSGKSARP